MSNCQSLLPDTDTLGCRYWELQLPFSVYQPAEVAAQKLETGWGQINLSLPLLSLPGFEPQLIYFLGFPGGIGAQGQPCPLKIK